MNLGLTVTLNLKLVFRSLNARKGASDYFQDWKSLSPEVFKTQTLTGIHHMENMQFARESYTPLLTANTQKHGKIPLAVASYPGKGRAIWIFSDNFWKLALEEYATSSRSNYHQFIAKALTWLSRQEMKKPLVIKNLKLTPTEGKTSWHAILKGPATKYLSQLDTWTIDVCNKNQELGNISQCYGKDEWK